MPPDDTGETFSTIILFICKSPVGARLRALHRSRLVIAPRQVGVFDVVRNRTSRGTPRSNFKEVRQRDDYNRIHEVFETQNFRR